MSRRIYYLIAIPLSSGFCVLRELCEQSQALYPDTEIHQAPVI